MAQPSGHEPVRAALPRLILVRTRFIEDLVAEQAASGVGQYVILGACLDTFASAGRTSPRAGSCSRFDQAGPQPLRRHHLVDTGFGISHSWRLVPVDFDSGDNWWEWLAEAGLDAAQPASVASSGVSMYLTDAIAATQRGIASLGPGSKLVVSFLLSIGLANLDVRPGIKCATEGASKRHALPQRFHAGGDACARP